MYLMLMMGYIYEHIVTKLNYREANLQRTTLVIFNKANQINFKEKKEK
jgi:hypothetical protein